MWEGEGGGGGEAERRGGGGGESMPMAWISTSSPTFAVSVGVLPAYARPLMHWNVRSRRVTAGGNWWACSE